MPPSGVVGIRQSDDILRMDRRGCFKHAVSLSKARRRMVTGIIPYTEVAVLGSWENSNSSDISRLGITFVADKHGGGNVGDGRSTDVFNTRDTWISRPGQSFQCLTPASCWYKRMSICQFNGGYASTSIRMRLPTCGIDSELVLGGPWNLFKYIYWLLFTKSDPTHECCLTPSFRSAKK